MKITNFTAVDSKQKSYEELVCSRELTGVMHNQLIIFSVVHSILSIAAFLGNTLILAALHKESSLHPPSKLLFRNLATTDLCVGLIVQPVYVTYFISALNERWNICRYAFDTLHITSYILCSVSLFTLAAISLDRLLALLLGLRYRQVVTLKRIYLTVACFWVVSIISSTMYFWAQHKTLWLGYIAPSLCLVTSIFSHAKIVLTLRHNQVQAQDHHVNQGQPIQTVQLTMARYRKTVTSVLWVQLALVICYLPESIMGALILRRGLSPAIFTARSFTGTLVFLNSSLNPILYCWKIREVRQAVKVAVRNFCSSC